MVLFLGFIGGAIKGAVSVVKSVTGLGSSKDVQTSSDLLNSVALITSQANAAAQQLKSQNDALMRQLQAQQAANEAAQQQAIAAAQAAQAAAAAQPPAALPSWLLPLGVGAVALILLRQHR